jgi:four helix bundle protein
MEKKYLKLNDIDAYKRAFHLSNNVWRIVIVWDYFPKNTVGSQFVRAVDSISANIAEGFGRYTKKDKIKFYRISIGSAKEALDWNEKCKSRGLIDNEEYSKILSDLQALSLEINQLIKYTDLVLAK